MHSKESVLQIISNLILQLRALGLKNGGCLVHIAEMNKLL